MRSLPNLNRNLPISKHFDPEPWPQVTGLAKECMARLVEATRREKAKSKAMPEAQGGAPSRIMP